MVVVGEYSRISDDDEKDPQHGKGIGRQQKDTGTLLQLRGWESGGKYVDDDTSAFQLNVVRKDFERMVADLEAGRIQGIAGYDVDRLFRQPSDLERVIKIYDKNPGLVFATVQGDINLMTPDGRTMARVLVAFANKSSMDTSRRVARQKLEKAMTGDSTSNFRAFGWNEDGTLHEDEAKLLKEAAEHALDGIGLPTIALRWNKRGIKTVRGKEWHSYTLRRVLSAPRIAGFAVYRGEIVLKDGQPVKGNWVPLMDEDQWRALLTVVNPRKGLPKVRRKRYLLSGIARCGLCGMGMVGATVNGKTRYQCRAPDSGGCAKVGILGTRLEQQIETLVLAYLQDHEIEQHDEPWTGQDRLDQIGGQIAELMGQYRSGGLSGSLVFPEVAKLEDEQRHLLAEKGQHIRANRPPLTIKGEWRDWGLEEKRAVIQSVLSAVVIKPVGRTGVYDPTRVEVIWH